MKPNFKTTPSSKKPSASSKPPSPSAPKPNGGATRDRAAPASDALSCEAPSGQVPPIGTAIGQLMCVPGHFAAQAPTGLCIPAQGNALGTVSSNPVHSAGAPQRDECGPPPAGTRACSATCASVVQEMAWRLNSPQATLFPTSASQCARGFKFRRPPTPRPLGRQPLPRLRCRPRRALPVKWRGGK